MESDQLTQTVFFKSDLNINIKKGIDILSDAVKTTMGPKGKLVMIEKDNFQHPIITKDGVTVAKSIYLEDKIQNMAVSVLKEAAIRTAEEAGDGTTTSTVLAQSIYNEGIKMMSAGYEINDIKSGIKSAESIVNNYLSTLKKDISSNDELKQVALISANGEEEIANLIVAAIKASGKDGTIIVEEAKGYRSSLTVVDGFNIGRGYLSPYFVTDKNKMQTVFKNPLILLADREFNSIHDLMKPLEISLEASKPILIVANELGGDSLQGLVLNKTKGSLRVCAIKSPGHGASRHEMLLDLQSIVGGQIIDNNFDMKAFKQADFGTCQNIIIKKNSTLIISNENNEARKDAIKERVTAIKDILSDHDNIISMQDQEKQLLNYRLQQLSGGISILKVGAPTESEMIERYDRVDDALNATKAAAEEGILPGGGVALVKSSFFLKKEIRDNNHNYKKVGLEILSRACLAPLKQILKNSNKSPDTILEKIETDNLNLGYDARENKFKDMYESGIIDPYKVVRCSLKNAISVALMLLDIDCCIVNNN